MNLIVLILKISFFLIAVFIVLIVLKLSVGEVREKCFLGRNNYPDRTFTIKK